MGILKELFETAVFFLVLHLIIPPVVDGFTRNSWSKLPTMLAMAVASAAVMAYFEYIPWLLAIIWLPSAYHSLKVISEPAFRAQHQRNLGAPPDLMVYRVSTYSYVVLSCLLAVAFQIKVMSPFGEVPLWRALLGRN